MKTGPLIPKRIKLTSWLSLKEQITPGARNPVWDRVFAETSKVIERQLNLTLLMHLTPQAASAL